MANAPVLILGNKIDIAGAASEDEIRMQFGLHGQTTGRVTQLSSTVTGLQTLYTKMLHNIEGGIQICSRMYARLS